MLTQTYYYLRVLGETTATTKILDSMINKILFFNLSIGAYLSFGIWDLYFN
jgi:hypothetical protein